MALIDDAPGNTLDEFTRPTTSTSFNTFNGGIEFKFAAGSWASGASFGDAGVVEAALDLYRLQARNDISGQSGFGAAVRSGSYEGTFTINQSGQVSFIVTGAAPAGYDSWATANGITGQPFTGDYDKDGLSNGVEYALGTNPTVFNSMPGLVSAGADFTLTVPKGTQAAADSALAYKFETSTDLSSWTMVNPTTQNSTSASYTLPGGLSKNFVRFKAVKTP